MKNFVAKALSALTLSLVAFGAHAETAHERAEVQTKVILEIAQELKIISPNTSDSKRALLTTALAPSAPLDLMTRVLVIAAVSDDHRVDNKQLSTMWSRLTENPAFIQDPAWGDFNRDFGDAINQLLGTPTRHGALTSIDISGDIDSDYREIVVNLSKVVEAKIYKGQKDKNGDSLEKTIVVGTMPEEGDSVSPVVLTATRDSDAAQQVIRTFKSTSTSYAKAKSLGESADDEQRLLVSVLDNASAENSSFVLFTRNERYGALGVKVSGMGTFSVNNAALVLPQDNAEGALAVAPLLNTERFASFTEGAAGRTYVQPKKAAK